MPDSRPFAVELDHAIDAFNEDDASQPLAPEVLLIGCQLPLAWKFLSVFDRDQVCIALKVLRRELGTDNSDSRQ
jgi:hypothetical protein